MTKRKSKVFGGRSKASGLEAELESAAKGLGLTTLPLIATEQLALRGASFAELGSDKPYEDILAEWAGVDKEQAGRVVAAIHAVVRGSGISYAKFAVLAVEALEGAQVRAKMGEASSTAE